MNMNRTQSHPDRERLSAYGLGRLDDVESGDVGRHLAVCERCRRVVEELPADPIMQLLQASYARPAPEGLYSRPSAGPAPSGGESRPPLYRKLAAIVARPATPTAPASETAATHVPGEKQRGRSSLRRRVLRSCVPFSSFLFVLFVLYSLDVKHLHV